MVGQLLGGEGGRASEAEWLGYLGRKKADKGAERFEAFLDFLENDFVFDEAKFRRRLGRFRESQDFKWLAENSTGTPQVTTRSIT